MSSCNGREGVGVCFMPTASWGARQTQQLARFIAITDTMRILYCTERSTICPCSLGLRGWVGGCGVVGGWDGGCIGGIGALWLRLGAGHHRIYHCSGLRGNIASLAETTR